MITVTRFDQSRFTLNADLIEFIEARPDTHITLVTGKKLLVCETTEEVISRVVEFAAGRAFSHALPCPGCMSAKRCARTNNTVAAGEIRDGFSNNYRPGSGLGAFFGSIIMEGGELKAMINPSAAVLVFGGTLGASMISFPLSAIIGLPGVVKNAFMGKHEDVGKIIKMLVGFAEKARREGLLALEDEAHSVEDTFLQEGHPACH